MHDFVCLCIQDIMLNRALEESVCYRELRVTEPCPVEADLCVYLFCTYHDVLCIVLG